jgi:hypothetical protein
MTGDPMPSTTSRRARLSTAANPAPWHDYRIGWSGTLACGTRVAVDLVPDRRVLTEDGFAGYLDALDAAPWPTLEALTTTVLDDLNNELVPRWVRVAATRSAGRTVHGVTIEDRQPDWSNPGLLAGLSAG